MTMKPLTETLFCGRLIDGSVRLIEFKSPPPSYPNQNLGYHASVVNLDLLFSHTQWANLVSMVSAGDCSRKYYVALALHMNEKCSLGNFIQGDDNATRLCQEDCQGKGHPT